MNDKELQQWVETISLQAFCRPFLHQASFNSRLRSTGGRYFTKNHNIEISSRHYQEFGAEETEAIIKHELCHYHLNLMGMGFRHGDADFKELLRRVGGARFCKPLPDMKRREPYRYKLICMNCRTEYLRKRQCNPRKYVCGSCKGRLRLVSIDPVLDFPKP